MLIDKRRNTKPVKNFINQMGQTARVADTLDNVARKTRSSLFWGGTEYCDGVEFLRNIHLIILIVTKSENSPKLYIHVYPTKVFFIPAESLFGFSVGLFLCH